MIGNADADGNAKNQSAAYINKTLNSIMISNTYDSTYYPSEISWETKGFAG